MTTLEIVEQLRKFPNGQFVTLHYRSDLRENGKLSSKAVKMGHSGYEDSQIQVRKGVDYANKEAVKDKRDGEAPDTEHPIWRGKGQHVNEPEYLVNGKSVVIRHADTGEEYICFDPSKFGPNSINAPKTEYFLDGQPISKEDLISSGLCTSKLTQEPSEWIIVKVKNIYKIG